MEVALNKVNGSAADQRTGHDMILVAVELFYCMIWIEGISCKLRILQWMQSSLPQELEALIDSGVFVSFSCRGNNR